jgi:hypothetical protein
VAFLGIHILTQLNIGVLQEHYNISYAVQQVCLFMHDPKTQNMSTLKRIIRYIHGTIDFGLHLYPSSVSKLVSYTDVDWLVVQTLGVPPLVIVFILATISSHGQPSANTHFLDQVQKSSTAASLTLFLNLVGLKTYYWNYIAFGLKTLFLIYL